MGDMVFFTDNYQDHSTDEGYQFEFFCERCGNGHTSPFQHSVTGFGGKLLQMGGDLVGGEIGGKAANLGWDAQWLRGGRRGSTRDKALGRAVEQMQPHFVQCHRCTQWVCKAICWNTERGMCTNCAPKLDQEIAGMQAAAQVDQLNEKIRQQDWTKDVNHREVAVGRCPSCSQDTGGGRFCQHCGTTLAAAPTAQKKFCTNCGTGLGTGKFCAECGWPAG